MKIFLFFFVQHPLLLGTYKPIGQYPVVEEVSLEFIWDSNGGHLLTCDKQRAVSYFVDSTGENMATEH